MDTPAPPTDATATPRARSTLRATRLRRAGLGLLTWVLAGLAMAALDGVVDLANLAMLLVLAAALSALWLDALSAMAISALAVLAFNFAFVPPRGTFTVDVHQHALLLGAMLAVSWIVAAVMAGQRLSAEQARHHARRAEQLRRFGDALRDAATPRAQAELLRAALAELIGGPAALLMLRRSPLPAADDVEAVDWVVDADAALAADQRAGLWLSLRQSRTFGPGSGRHDELPDAYLPLRGASAGPGGSVGAVLVRVGGRVGGHIGDHDRLDAARWAQAQALCDQFGAQLQRHLSAQQAVDAQGQAQDQAVRNALLAAISHDYRTPLATILGAATSMVEQGARMDAAQRERLARAIADETRQLSRVTDNTLHLARLDAPGVVLQRDWESAEEIVGTVLRHARGHDPERRVRARLEPDLPLLRCDALLVVQLLDNLVDNALKYSPAPAPVEIVARRQWLPAAGARTGWAAALPRQGVEVGDPATGQPVLVLAVRDRGPGVSPAWRERVFEVFQRGDPALHATPSPLAPAADDAAPMPTWRGAGVGLAVCRAIARAHGGELRLRARAHGGSSFECVLPVEPGPAAAPAMSEASPSAPSAPPSDFGASVL